MLSSTSNGMKAKTPDTYLESFPELAVDLAIALDRRINRRYGLPAFKIAKQNHHMNSLEKAKEIGRRGRKVTVAATGKEKRDGNLRRYLCELHSTTDPMCFGISPHHDSVSQYLTDIV